MAARPAAIRVGRWGSAALDIALALTLALTLASHPLRAQTRITLYQLGLRKAPDYSATYAGQRVLVRGVVSAPAYRVGEFLALGIQDDHNGGVLKVLSFTEHVRSDDDAKFLGR